MFFLSNQVNNEISGSDEIQNRSKQPHNSEKMQIFQLRGKMFLSDFPLYLPSLTLFNVQFFHSLTDIFDNLCRCAYISSILISHRFYYWINRSSLVLVWINSYELNFFTKDIFKKYFLSVSIKQFLKIYVLFIKDLYLFK